MKSGKKELSKELFQLLCNNLKVRIIAGIFAVFASAGFVFLDELKTLTRELFFSGTVKVIAEDQSLKKHSQVIILDANHSPQSTFLLDTTQTSAKLPPGNYIIQIYYPKANGSKELILEKPFELERREQENISLTHKLPNIINVNMETPKDEFAPEEQIYFTVLTNRDSYVWLFSPDSKGNPNLIFPNESCEDNRIEAGKTYAIPPHDTFTLKTRSTPGEEVIVSVATEINDKQLALTCLKKVFPSVSLKVSVTEEALWGYDKKTIKVK
jgi:hypothetical protein